jgi:uncharacterized membrane protein (UPF0127 family)
VLEINAGLAEQLKLKVGNPLKSNAIKPVE